MSSKNRIGIWIFTLAVLTLLLRPYLVYQMTADIQKPDPARAWGLLQRLVKKKDDHHEQLADAVITSTDKTSRSVHPVRRLVNSVARFFAAIRTVNFAVQFNNRHSLPVRIHLYRLSCCFLI